MKAINVLKTLFTSSVQEYILGAHSSKSAVQRLNHGITLVAGDEKPYQPHGKST